jgi:hypothetical protein
MEARLSGPHAASAVELKQRLETERRGGPFLILRDGDGHQRLLELPDSPTAVLTVGRNPDCDIALVWDDQVSRVHAELARVGLDWAVADGGLSRNGTYLNGRRIEERRRLADGDTMRFGATAVLFRRPAGGAQGSATVEATDLPEPGDLSTAQRAVLRELCRPFAAGAGRERPATNPEIAAALYLSLDAVKGHLRVLFVKFGVNELPQNQKRLRLAERALLTGAISRADLRADD